MRNLLYLVLFHCIYQSCTLEDDMEDLLDTTNEEMDMKPLKLIAEAKARSGGACGFWSGSAVIFDVQCSIMNHVVEPKYSIIFNQVNINLGKAYSRHTGKFRSPVRGVYFFSYSSLPFRGLHTDVALMKNGQKISLIHSVLSTGSSQLAVKNAILKLNRGDRVWVKLEKGKLWSRDGSISFQGFLLTPLC